jgi:hypothetical protein
MVAEGAVRAGAASVAAPGRAAAGPCPPYSLRLVAVRAQVSRGAPPPLPDGYTVGEKVFYTGSSQTLSNGDKLVHGQQGEVMGPATLETHKGKGVNVRFPGNTGNVSCLLTSVRRLRAASAADPPRACAPHTRDGAHAPCVPTTASAAAPQPSLHAQPRAPQPTARVREGWCGRGRGAGGPPRWQRQGGRRPRPALLTPYGWWLCVRR